MRQEEGQLRLQQPRQGGFLLGLQSIQWMVFLIANVIAVPIVVGTAFHLSPTEISSFVQRMLLMTGVGTLIQVFIGHRLPIVEGSAGMWWALFLLLGAMAVPGEEGLVLQQLEMGLLIAGAVLVLVSFLPIMTRIRDLFTPLVTGVYLVLLVIQLSGGFFRGMFGVSMTGHVDWRVAGISLLVVVLVLLVSLKAKGLWKSMGPLIGISVGWLIYAGLGLTGGEELQAEGSGWFSLPELFAWGAPVWNFGIILTSVLTGLILISNVVASILVVAKSLDQDVDAGTYRRGLLGNGLSSILSGGFSIIGLVPLSVSAGFIMTTGIRNKLPFIIGTVLVGVSGLVPYVGHFFATLPSEVAYAALFVPFAQMMGFGIRDLMGVSPTQRNLLVIGISLMVGAGMMFLPQEALQSIAPWARNLLANGLLVGLLVCLVLEHLIFRKKEETT
ncbi:MAG TPA: purine/pyrimidine permease [Bacilli bacterium]|nr:purine/pyrimidine permease [Bacilli bacterium]